MMNILGKRQCIDCNLLQCNVLLNFVLFRFNTDSNWTTNQMLCACGFRVILRPGAAVGSLICASSVDGHRPWKALNCGPCGAASQ